MDYIQYIINPPFIPEPAIVCIWYPILWYLLYILVNNIIKIIMSKINQKVDYIAITQSADKIPQPSNKIPPNEKIQQTNKTPPDEIPPNEIPPDEIPQQSNKTPADEIPQPPNKIPPDEITQPSNKTPPNKTPPDEIPQPSSTTSPIQHRPRKKKGQQKKKCENDEENEHMQKQVDGFKNQVQGMFDAIANVLKDVHPAAATYTDSMREAMKYALDEDDENNKEELPSEDTPAPTPCEQDLSEADLIQQILSEAENKPPADPFKTQEKLCPTAKIDRLIETGQRFTRGILEGARDGEEDPQKKENLTKLLTSVDKVNELIDDVVHDENSVPRLAMNKVLQLVAPTKDQKLLTTGNVEEITDDTPEVKENIDDSEQTEGNENTISPKKLWADYSDDSDVDNYDIYEKPQYTAENFTTVTRDKYRSPNNNGNNNNGNNNNGNKHNSNNTKRNKNFAAKRIHRRQTSSFN